MNEHELQKSIVAECNLRANQDPRYGLLMAIPNGQYRPGQRMEPGMRAGAPDLFLPVPRSATKAHPEYHGMFLELKVRANRPTGDQARWLRMLREQGYYACWVRDDPVDAMHLLIWYLDGDE